MEIDIPPIVAVDSMTLVWGIREQGTEEQCNRAKWLLSKFTARKTQVIVSAMVLSEYLTAIDPVNHAAVLVPMGKRFLLRSVTPECSPIAASLFQLGSQMRVKGAAGGRAILRADTLVIAAAKIHGAGRLYTNDGDCRDLANRMWPNFAHDVPVAPKDLWGHLLE